MYEYMRNTTALDNAVARAYSYACEATPDQTELTEYQKLDIAKNCFSLECWDYVTTDHQEIIEQEFADALLMNPPAPAKRYTIQLAIYEVFEDGDTAEQETEGVTLDYATTDLETLSKIMSECYEHGNAIIWERGEVEPTDRRTEYDYDG